MQATPTTKPITNITSIECLQVLKSIEYYSSDLINKVHSHLQEIKNTSNMNLNHLITPCKPSAYSNTTTYYKTNHKHLKYNAYKY